MNQHSGIALIQVLVITAILAILSLYFSKSARQQVTFALDYQDKVAALIKHHDAESQLLFALLNEPRTPGVKPNIPTFPFVMNWNDFDVEFDIDEYTVAKMQDQRGLIDLHYPDQTRILRLLTSNGLNDYDATSLINLLKDLQDLDSQTQLNRQELRYRNGVLQNYDELYAYGIDSKSIQILKSTTSIYKGRGFNPLSSPQPLLKAITSEYVSKQLLAMRNNGSVDIRRFSLLANIGEGDEVIFYPSNDTRVILVTSVGKAKVRSEYLLRLKPSKSAPVNVVGKQVSDYYD